MTVIDQHWTAYGRCADAPPDELFVEGAAQRTARQVCAECPVRRDCLVDALDNRVLFGVWGGMTERERRALLRRFPDVTSWRDLVESDPDLLAWPGPYHAGRHRHRRSLERQGAHGAALGG